MELSRRGFLSLLAGTATAVSVGGIELLDPLWIPGKKSIFLPPRVGNTLLTAEWVSREALRILAARLEQYHRLNGKYYANEFRGGILVPNVTTISREIVLT